MELTKLNHPSYDTESIDSRRVYLECETMLAQADTLLRAKQVQESVELLLKILQRNSQFGKAYNYLGWIYEIEYKNYSRAEEYYKSAMKYEPEYSVPYIHYARLLSSCRRFDELKAHLDIAFTIVTVSKEAIYSEYAIMYEMQENPATAIEYYAKAAMATLDARQIIIYQESINRCKVKLELKSSLSDR
jgi:tetratricopeptide (TPR) repeat protein